MLSDTCGLDLVRARGNHAPVPRKRDGPGARRYASVGSWLGTLRRRAGIEQSELAEKAGISEDQVSRLERGENVGLWYLSVAVSALEEVLAHDERKHPLVWALAVDGSEISSVGELKKRFRGRRKTKVAGKAKVGEVNAPINPRRQGRG